MKIDIICPLYNAENDIENLHESFLEQKNVNINEIKYVLTECKDRTEEKLKKMNLKYKIIQRDEFSHSITREKEAFESEADILVFVTQDVKILRDDWLYYLTKDIIDGKVDACYSRQLCNNNTIEKYTRECNYPNESKIVSKNDINTIGLKAFFFSDASSAIKRETFVKLNGYDGKNFPTNEDMYIAYKLITNGYKIKYCAESEVVHSHKFTLKQYYKRYKDTGVFFKQNSYLNKYKVNQAGGSMAKYVLKRAIQDRNWSVLVKFIPNMVARFIGMKMGKLENSKSIVKHSYDIAYVCSTLKRVGPTNQTLNIIKYSPYKKRSVVITIFSEDEMDTMIKEYQQEGIDIIPMNSTKKNVFFSAKKLKKILKKYNIKIVHSYGIIPDYISQKASKKICEHIITLRNFPKEDIFTRMRLIPAYVAYSIHITILKKNDNLVTCSNTIKEKMQKEYKIKKIDAIQNGVDVIKFKRIGEHEKDILRKKYDMEGQVIFISTSSFIPRKRIEETIQAFIQAKVKNSILLLLGTGSIYDEIYYKYKDICNIVFIGKTDKVIEYLQLSDIFISTSESEGLPNGVLEAISVGLPVLVSNIPQHKEIMESVKNVGVLYELGNINELSSYMKNYKSIAKMNDKDYITNSDLNMETMSKKYANYYKKILDGNKLCKY